MTLILSDLEHLNAEGWEQRHIDWAVDHGLRSITEQEASELNIGCRSVSGFVNPAGLFFEYGDSNGHTYGQLRCHESIRRPGGGLAPKYLPTVGVKPIVWAPGDPIAITEGWKDGAASFLRHEIPMAAIGAPSYFRCLEDQLPGVPYILDPDTPFVLEVWRILVGCGLEQDRKIGHLPWMPDHPKGGFTEFCFKHGASQQDVMNVIGGAIRPKDYLFRLAETWVKAADEQWQAANKGAELARVPLLKSRSAEQLAKTAAACLSTAEAGSLFNVIYRYCGVRKGDLMQIFNARQAKAQRQRREAARQEQQSSGKPIYAVDAGTTLEACVIHNLNAAHGGQMVARNLQFWRWADQQHHWERRSGHEIKHWLSKDLERYFEPPASDRDIPRFRFSTLEHIKRVTGYLQIRLDDQRLDASPHLIPFTNGVLDVTTGELLPHSPDHGCTYCIQGNYSPPGKGKLGPAFSHLLKTSYDAKHHQMLRAGLRLLVDPTMPSGKCLVLEGGSGSGKGALVNGVIRRFFPTHAVSALQTLDQLSSKEAIYQSVLGKRLITFGDLLGKQSKYGGFYELVDQSMVTARRLFESEEITIDFAGRFVLAMTKMPIFLDDDGNTGWMRRAFIVPTIPGQRDRSLYPRDLEADLATEVGSIASWALAMDRQEAIDILQGRSDDPEVELVQATAAASTDSLSEFIDHCLEPAKGTVEPDQVDLIDAYRLFCRTTNKNALADARFIGQLRKAIPHLHQQRRRIPRADARDRGVDADNRWLPARFFGFTIDEEIWRREATDELPLKTFDSNDFRTGVDWDSTLASWKRAGLAFEWDRDSKCSRTGFISRDTLQSAEGRLLELRQHHPKPHGD